jgi:hypothetical protein
VLRTNAATDVHLHRFAPAPGRSVLLETVQPCGCGRQHPAVRQAFLCLEPGCGFLLTMPVGN